MLVVAQAQASIFLYCAGFGCLFGVVYEVGKFVRALFLHKFFITLLVDFFVFFTSGMLFFLSLLHTTQGAFYMYQLVAFWLGFLLERVSFGFLFAKLLHIVYTKTANVRKKVKQSAFVKKVLR